MVERLKARFLFGEMAVHGFFGVIVMMAATPLVKTFTNPPAWWNLDLPDLDSYTQYPVRLRQSDMGRTATDKDNKET